MALLVVTLGGTLLLASLGWSRLAPAPGAPDRDPGSEPARLAVPPPSPSRFVLVQTNLCLSGMSGCYEKVDYPAGLRDAVTLVRRVRPDAVTVNESCRADARTLARRTGYHVRFVRIIYAEQRLACVDPGGRGLFGDAILTRAPVRASESRVFGSQFGPEERRWLCVTIRSGRGGRDVCTAHLEIRSGAYAEANDGQCDELRALLAERARSRPVVFGGDVNRGRSCAPDGFWSRTDRDAEQAPGVQHVYVSRDGFRTPRARLLPARHSDHDVLLVRARVRR